MKTYQMFLNGQFCKKGVLRDIVQPYNGKPFAKVYFGNEEILKEAINGAGIAFKTMKSTPSHVISDILRRVSQKLKERSEEFAKTLALEAGKPIKTARIWNDKALSSRCDWSDYPIQFSSEPGRA
jgi:acyl-CoA reductase-like NAD-dependent aldehyde dehydrogenase